MVIDFARLWKLTEASAFFVTRAKTNLRFTRYRSLQVDYSIGVRSDQIGTLTVPKARAHYPAVLRKIRYFDTETLHTLVFLTNAFDLPALVVAKLYKPRWQIELFFKWIKQNLRLKHFFGISENAVKIQIWIAVIVYVSVAVIHKQLHLTRPLHTFLQILSVTPFEQVPIAELFTDQSLA